VAATTATIQTSMSLTIKVMINRTVMIDTQYYNNNIIIIKLSIQLLLHVSIAVKLSLLTCIDSYYATVSVSKM
jgi:hypothetical protein